MFWLELMRTVLRLSACLRCAADRQHLRPCHIGGELPVAASEHEDGLFGHTGHIAKRYRRRKLCHHQGGAREIVAVRIDRLTVTREVREASLPESDVKLSDKGKWLDRETIAHIPDALYHAGTASTDSKQCIRFKEI